jgi:hypothetical protein
MVGEAAVTDLDDSAGRGDLFLVGEITAALVTVVSEDAIATFAVVVFAIFMGTSPISASIGSAIRIITSTTTRITTHTPIRKLRCILKGRVIIWDHRTSKIGGVIPGSSLRTMPAATFNGISC